MEKRSLNTAACAAASDYREQLRRRLGDEFAEEGVREWNRDHWWPWVCERAVEHLLGDAYWVEFGARTFASISAETPERVAMLDEYRGIVARTGSHDGLASRLADEERRAAIINRLLD